MKRYAEVLRVPHVAPLIAATLIARFPIGINALALILYLRARDRLVRDRRRRGGRARGRGRDRRAGPGAARRLASASGACSSRSRSSTPPRSAASSALAELGAPDRRCSSPARVSAGFAIPPTSSVLRSMWPTLLRDREELLQPAYALDSVLIELIFILGPLLTACSPPGVSPASALIVSAASVITGTIWFTAQAPSRAFEPDREAPRRAASARSPRRACARWSSPRCPRAIGIGMVEVGLPAFSDAEGAAELAGLLLAVWSLGSAAGGLLYGALPRRPPLGRLHLAVSALLPLGLLPLAAASSVAGDGAAGHPGGRCSSRRCSRPATS